MAIALALTDGTTTVTLSGTSPVRGCTYFPQTAQYRNGEWQQVNDTVLRYSGHPPRSLSAFATELALTMSFNGEGHRQTAVPSMA